MEQPRDSFIEPDKRNMQIKILKYKVPKNCAISSGNKRKDIIIKEEGLIYY